MAGDKIVIVTGKVDGDIFVTGGDSVGIES